MTPAVESAAPPVPAARRPGDWLSIGADRWLPLLLLLPSILMIAATIAYPLIQALLYSFADGTLLRPGRFVGLGNYARLLASAEFRHALIFSTVFAVASVSGSYLLGLGLALLLNLDIPFRGIFRVALLLPWIVPSIVSIVSWRMLLIDEHALANVLIRGLGGSPVFFLSDETWAVVAVVLVKIWRAFPFMMLSILAALQGIDRTLYEAAAIDGASRPQMFRHITLPQIRNLSIVLCLLMTIWSVNDFDTPWLLTQGGPAFATENLVLLSHRYTFGRNQLGLGSATSFVTLLILMVLIVVMLRRQREQ